MSKPLAVSSALVAALAATVAPRPGAGRAQRRTEVVRPRP